MPSSVFDTEPSDLRRLIRFIGRALTAGGDNAAKGPLRRAIPLLAIPMVLEMAMESLFALSDVYFVAQLGAPAVAAVGMTESIIAIVYAVAFGLAMPTGAMVARRIGEGDPEGASRTAVQAVWLALLVGGLLACSVFLAPQLLALMGAQADVMAAGRGFMEISLLGSPFITLLFVHGAVFRGAGDPRRAMRAMWLANGLNILLDPCLIFGWGPFPDLGVSGAAVATLVGRGCGVLYQLVHLWRGPLIALAQQTRVQLSVMGRIALLSIGAAVQHLVEIGSWIALVRVVADLGSAHLAAYTITVRLAMFFLMPAWGFSNATATLVGQSLGARDPSRAERAVWLSGFYASPFLFAVTLLFTLFPTTLAAGFSNDPEVVQAAQGGLYALAFGYVFYGWQMVTQQALNGAGDTQSPAVINIGCFWVLQIPLAYSLAIPAELGIAGVFAAASLSYTVAAVWGVLLVRRGRWKQVEV
ncbi:MAG: MATE family efflux transporter [Myxococcota bacterium]